MTDQILIAGGTGRTGQIIVRNLVTSGIYPKLLVRDLSKAEALFGETLSYHVGDVRDYETLLNPMQGIQTVISAVGSCTPVGKNCPKRVDYEGVVNLINAAQTQGVKRFILISSIAVTHPEHPLNRFGKILDWKLKGEEALRHSGLDYAIVRPGGLKDTPGGCHSLVFDQGDQILGTISREDLADTCVEIAHGQHPFPVTFEVVEADEKGCPDWVQLFSALVPDDGQNR